MGYAIVAVMMAFLAFYGFADKEIISVKEMLMGSALAVGLSVGLSALVKKWTKRG